MVQDPGNMLECADTPSADHEPNIFFDQSQQSNKQPGRARKASYVQDPIYQNTAKRQKQLPRHARSRLSAMA